MADMKKYHPSITTKTGEMIVDILADYGSHNMETENISSQMHLITDLGYDSFDRIRIINDFEDDFGINILDADVDEILADPTVGKLIDYVENALVGKAQEA